VLSNDDALKRDMLRELAKTRIEKKEGDHF
jgi:hypothetical protein